jgi:hypothetical protein
VFDVVRIGKCEVGQEQLVDRQIGPALGGWGGEPTSVDESLGQQSIEFGSALWGAVPTEVDVAAVDRDDGLPARLVEPARGGTEGVNGHGSNLQIR